MGITGFDAGAQILDTGVIQHIGTDLAAPTDIRLGLFQGLFLSVLLLNFQLVELGFQLLHTLVFVFVLGTVVLALYHDTGRNVGNTHRGFGSVNVLISGVVGLLFIGVGNYLPRVKQNYTLGIKTPWALADPENWRRTQRFGGACFMVLGIGLIVMGVAGSVLSSEVVAAVIAVLAFGSVGAVYVYSYLLCVSRASVSTQSA